MTSQYANFPVQETFDLKEIAEIRLAADKMADAYEKSTEEFSFRILLPRSDKSTSRAKKLGITLQGEFVLTLRKRNIVPIVRELRYVHDEAHYGWILASSQMFDKYEQKN
jgi:hypothetical protein